MVWLAADDAGRETVRRSQPGVRQRLRRRGAQHARAVDGDGNGEVARGIGRREAAARRCAGVFAETQLSVLISLREMTFISRSEMSKLKISAARSSGRRTSTSPG